MGGRSSVLDSEMKDEHLYAHCEEDDGRSATYLEAASRAERRRPQNCDRTEAQTSAGVISFGVPAAGSGGTVRSSETEVVAPESARALRAKIHQLQAQLAQEQQINKQIDGQLKTHVRQARARVAQTEQQLENIKVRLVHEQHQSADGRASLRRANVLLNSKRQELKDLRASHDRLRAIVEDRNAARLLAGGINIQAACPTSPEIEAHVRRALTVTVSEWIEQAPPDILAALWFPWMVSRIFLECRALVDGIVREYNPFMEGGVGRDDEASMVDEATTDMFRQHVRRHHRTMFPLTGEALDRACTEVASRIGRWLEPAVFGSSRDGIAQELIEMKLDRVVAEYLTILVGAALQHPAVIPSKDCGTVQAFDATIHAESIDGDALEKGQPCLVVFPVLLVKGGSGANSQPLNKPYVLPVVTKS